jgi:hypothetical protein
VHHGDVADAGRYGLQGYFDYSEAPAAVLTPAQAQAKAEADAVKQLFERPGMSEAWQTRDCVLYSLGLGPGGSDDPT